MLNIIPLRRIRRLAVFQKNCCFYCGCKLVFRNGKYRGLTISHPRLATRDHFDPKANGGGGEDANIVIACYDCNQEKRDREPTPEERERFAVLDAARRAANYGVLRAEDCTHRPRQPAQARKVELQASQFGRNSAALLDLCDRANALGPKGNGLRRRIRARLESMRAAIAALKSVENEDFRYEVMRALFKERRSQWAPIEQPFNDMLDNTIATMIAVACNKERLSRIRRFADDNLPDEQAA